MLLAQITNIGNDPVAFTFFIGCMAMFASSVFFFVERDSVDDKWKLSLLVSALITGIAAVHYLYMRDYYMETGDNPTAYRYVDWILTVPLMCVEFYLLTRLAGATKALLENIKKRFDTTTIGFFLADSSHNFKYKIQDCDREAYYGDDFKPYNREYQKNKCVTFKGKLGYDELYIVKSWKGALNTDAVDFDPDADASKGQLTSQFKKFSKSKKLNKTLLTNFGKAVAE